MKKTSSSLGIFSAIFLLATTPALAALEIEISPSGQIVFYQGSVLGDHKEARSENRGSSKVENQGGRKEIEIRREDNQANESRTRIRSVSPQENKELKIRTVEDKVEVELRQKSRQSESRNLFESKEQLLDDGLELVFPPVDESLETDLDESETDEPETDELADYRERILQQRRERNDELVELSTEVEQGESELEIKSRGAQARLVQGAIFNLDPETNRVTITTPSGNEHVLYHLPDQAISGMLKAGKLSILEDLEDPEDLENPEDSELLDDLEIEIEEDEDGGLVYTVEDTQEVRFLGIIPREVPVEVQLDDDTGEVTTSVVEDRTIIQQLLDAMSF